MCQHRILLSLCLIAVLIPATPAQDKVASLPKLIEQLTRGNDAAKIAAAVAIADIGPDAKGAVPPLVMMLQAKGEDLRLNAAIALGKIGSAAVQPVARVAASQYPNDRYYAIWTLGWIGPAAKETAPLIIAALADKDDGVRRKAAYALGRIAPEPKDAMGPLIKAFADGNADVRKAAADTLAKFGTQAAPPLIAALKDDSPTIRAEAARALGNMGSDAKEAVPHLQTLFMAQDPKVSNEAADALARIGKPALSALSEALKSDNVALRTRAVQTLGKIGVDAVPMLVDALGDQHADVRRAAAIALTPLRISDKLVVLALAHAVHDTDPAVRQQSVQALQLLGSGARPASPKLVSAIKNADELTRIKILSVLQNIGESEQTIQVASDLLKEGSVRMRITAVNVLGSQGTKATPHLLAALKDEDLSVRFAAANAIQRTPGDIKDALPGLVPLLTQGTLFQRRNVVLALGRMGEPALPHLIGLLTSPDNLIRATAAQTLGSFGSDAKKAVPTLSGMVLQDSFIMARSAALQAIAAIEPDKLGDVFAQVQKHKDEKVRLTAYQSLSNRFVKKGGGVTTIPPKLALSHLVEATKDPAASVRLVGVQGLGNLGNDAKAAIPAITALLEDADARVRNQAQIALTQIRGK